MLARAAVLLLLGLLAAGCPPDLGDFRLVGDGGGSASDGGEGGDAPPAGPCPLPHLLVAVENVSGQSLGGSVLRIPLAADGACGRLTGGGELPAQPMAVAWLPPYVVAATRDGVFALDPATDAVAWRNTDHAGGLPIDAFPLEVGGAPAVAVAYFNTGTVSYIGPVAAYRDGLVVADWTAGGAFPPAAVLGMTRSVRHPERVLALRPIDYAAAEIDPATAQTYASPPYVRTRTDVELLTIHSLHDGTQLRTAWVGRLEDTSERVFYLNDSSAGGADLTVMGGIRCGDESCEYAHAVPDPTLNTRFLAICMDTGVHGRVVRFKSTDATTCEVLADSADLGVSARFARLAVAQAP